MNMWNLKVFRDLRDPGKPGDGVPTAFAPIIASAVGTSPNSLCCWEISQQPGLLGHLPTAAQGPPKGQGPGSGSDRDDFVVTDDHDIPHVSDSPKSTLARLNLSNLSPKSFLGSC